MMTKIFLVTSLLVFAGCASQSNRKPAQADLAFYEIVKSEERSAKFCPDAAKGAVCKMTWKEALDYCENIGGHLPTAREYLSILTPHGTKVLERSEVKGAPPAGYYFVDCKNPDGTLDAFFMNHSAYKRPPGEKGNHLLWTASIPPAHPTHAHVLYDEWGGGGGHPKDHLLTVRNSFQCVSVVD